MMGMLGIFGEGTDSCATIEQPSFTTPVSSLSFKTLSSDLEKRPSVLPSRTVCFQPQAHSPLLDFHFTFTHNCWLHAVAPLVRTTIAIGSIQTCAGAPAACAQQTLIM